MVYGVCRRILGNDADAEDAFQATFLVLVRKAATIRPRGMVSNWLYGVAHNTAIKAKSMNHQRQRKEREAGTMPKAEDNEEVWSQMQSLVDTELSRLPDKYRVPIVLCDLEGKTIREAVHHLGWPQGTVASRLTRGRALLARRLSKHGMQVTVGLLAGALGQSVASAAVPPALTAATIEAGCLLAAGKTAAASGVSATALALTDGVLKTMLLAKLKVAAVTVLVTTLLTAGIGVVYCKWLGGDSPICCSPRESASVPTPLAPERTDEVAKGITDAVKDEPEQSVTEPKTKECCDTQALPTKVFVIHGYALNPSDPHAKAIMDLYGAKMHQSVQTHAIEVHIAPNGAVATGKPVAVPGPQAKGPPAVVALIRTWSSEQMTLVVHKGKYYLIRPLHHGRSNNAQPMRSGPISWGVAPDGTRVLVIGSMNDKHFTLSIRGLRVDRSDGGENCAGQAAILPPNTNGKHGETSTNGAVGAGWFHFAP
jgi:RNA polymerase sigma factor (sigma-70 family)